jgi:hypothetical protein
MNSMRIQQSRTERRASIIFRFLHKDTLELGMLPREGWKPTSERVIGYMRDMFISALSRQQVFFDTYLMSLSEGIIEQLPLSAAPLTISDDSLFLVLYDPFGDDEGLVVWNTAEKKELVRLPPLSLRVVGASIRFLTNSLLLVLYTPDSPLHPRLPGKRPTTGGCSESRVRVREYPHLQAQTFGHLEPGDEVEVLDRSGVKMRIGDRTDRRYKVRRKSDGITGWAYGAYLKLAEYQDLSPRYKK